MASLCFFLGVYKDQSLAKTSIQKLKLFYPQADIISISDGVEDADYAEFCADYKVNYWVRERLKTMQFGGLWTAQFLTAMLWSEADILIKLDPDSGINSQLDPSTFPNADLFGNLRVAGGRPHIQGGFIAFRRAAARAIIESKLLGSSEYCTTHYSYPRFMPPYLQQGEQFSTEWLTCEDVILWDVIQKLGLKVAEYDQVWCHFKDACPSPEKYAVVHPVKELVA